MITFYKKKNRLLTVCITHTLTVTLTLFLPFPYWERETRSIQMLNLSKDVLPPRWKNRKKKNLRKPTHQEQR